MLIFCLLANMTQLCESTSTLFDQTKYEYKKLPLNICVLPIYQTLHLNIILHVQHLPSKATSRLGLFVSGAHLIG